MLLNLIVGIEPTTLVPSTNAWTIKLNHLVYK